MPDNVLFVNSAGNGGPQTSPGTSYNGITVGVTDGPSTPGPTTDGRSKPDITSPGFGLHELFDTLRVGCGSDSDASRSPR